MIATLSADTSQAGSQESSNPCDGLPPITMSVFLDVLERQGTLTKTTTAPSGDCSLSLTLAHDTSDVATPSGNTTPVSPTCTVSAVPKPEEPQGTVVGVGTTGQCEDVVVTFRVDIGARPLSPSPEDTTPNGVLGEEALGQRTVAARITVIDLISLNIIEHETTLTWRFSGSRVSDGSGTPYLSYSRYWNEPSVTSGLITTSPTQYTAYSQAVWHSDGLFIDQSPDVDILTRVTAFGFADGRGWCSFRMTGIVVPRVYQLHWYGHCQG